MFRDSHYATALKKAVAHASLLQEIMHCSRFLKCSFEVTSFITLHTSQEPFFPLDKFAKEIPT